MGEVKEVKVHGYWSSPYSMRVEMALKFKGIPYEYIEEDFEAKSQLLLQYNPVYKKVPVFVHNGRPIAESMVILEYIEDQWKDTPLLPEDPYKRAMVRFWANFFDQKLLPSGGPIMKSEGEEQDKAKEDFAENLRMLEEGLEKDFSGGTPFFNGQLPGFLDIVIGSALCSFRSIEKGIGFTLVDPLKYPLLFSWLATFIDLDVVKETSPPYDKHVAYVQKLRARALQALKG